jgi:putative component of toxin-antitoxin plasmid stabilization module
MKIDVGKGYRAYFTQRGDVPVISYTLSTQAD